MNEEKNTGAVGRVDDLSPTQRALQAKNKSLAKLLRQREAEKRRPRKPKTQK